MLHTSDSSVNAAIKEHNQQLAQAEMLKRVGKTVQDLEKAKKKMRKLCVDGGRSSVQLDYSPGLIKPTFKKILYTQATVSQRQGLTAQAEGQGESTADKLARKFTKMKDKAGLSQSRKQRQLFEEVFECAAGGRGGK